MELRLEFDQIDVGYNGQGGGDGFIDFQEIVNHLIKQNQMQPDEAHQLAQEIMDNFDENQDNRISLEEYSDKYVEILKKLRYRQVEMEDKMLESYEQFKHCTKLL